MVGARPKPIEDSRESGVCSRESAVYGRQSRVESPESKAWKEGLGIEGLGG